MFYLPLPALTRSLCTGLLVLGMVGCTSNITNQPSPDPSPLPVTATPTPTPAAVPTPQVDTYQPALEKAESAQSIARVAQSKDDWLLVANRWQQAIELIQVVPASSPHAKQAQGKLVEFKRSLLAARKQALLQEKQAAVALSTTTTTTSSTTGGGIFSSASSCSYIQQQINQIRNSMQRQNSDIRNNELSQDLSNLYNQYYRYCYNRPNRR